jgi:alpha-D-xyloside xylohydrolase
MRAMLLEVPDDPACACLDRQYMLGGSLLAAPVFSETGTVSYYLPPGKWTNIISGAAVTGGGWQTEQHDYCSLPLLARPNSIIALGGSGTRPDYDYADGIVFHVFELEDGAGFEVWDIRGNIEGRLEISRTKNRVEAACQGLEKTWSICLRNIHRFSSVDGARPKDSAEGLLLFPERGAGKISLEL